MLELNTKFDEHLPFERGALPWLNKNHGKTKKITPVETIKADFPTQRTQKIASNKIAPHIPCDTKTVRAARHTQSSSAENPIISKCFFNILGFFLGNSSTICRVTPIRPAENHPLSFPACTEDCKEDTP